MARTTVYGYVTRLPKDEREVMWETGGYQGENPEGSYLHKFSDHEGWRQPVYTRLDMEYFMSKPIEYKFEPLSGRLTSVRPTRPSPIEEFDKKVAAEAPKTLLVDEMPAVAVEAPVVEAPKRRMGRPPKSESNIGVN